MSDIITKFAKLDLRAIIAECPMEPEARFIAEIYAELGSFPFRIRKVKQAGWRAASDTIDPCPIGAEKNIVDRQMNEFWLNDVVNRNGVRILTRDTRSWILLGH